jgi:glycine cleavage system T protein (aminomethyltransferase)
MPGNKRGVIAAVFPRAQVMPKKPPFFDFLNRRTEADYDFLLSNGHEEEDYINWNDFLLPTHFGDWQYEYHAIRNSCALFDVSPLRKIRIQGSEACLLLDRLLTRPVSGLATMRASYAIFCNQDASLKDDIVLYKLADDDYLIMPSDIDHTPYFIELCTQFGYTEIEFTECTQDWVGLAIQGPQSASVMLAMGVSGIENLRPFEIRNFEVDGAQYMIARMGFTADLGYECWMAPAEAKAFTSKLTNVRRELSIDLPGYALAALEACRLEGGFVVAGWDFSTELDPSPGFERSPYELGLGWLVNIDAGDFVGRTALAAQLQQGFQYTFRQFTIAQNVELPESSAVFSLVDGIETTIGSVNCASYSPGLEQTIGNASLLSEFKELTEGWIIIGERRIAIELVSEALINRSYRNQVPAPLN